MSWWFRQSVVGVTWFEIWFYRVLDQLAWLKSKKVEEEADKYFQLDGSCGNQRQWWLAAGWKRRHRCRWEWVSPIKGIKTRQVHSVCQMGVGTVSIASTAIYLRMLCTARRCLNQLGPPPGNGDGSDARFPSTCLSHASRCTSQCKPCHYYEWAAIVRYGVLLTVDYYIVLPMGSIRMGWRKPILQGYSFSMTPSKMKSWYHLNHHNHKMQRHGHNEVHARLYSGSSWTNNF